MLAVSGRKEKSWSLKGKGPRQKKGSKAILAPPMEIDIVLWPGGLVVPQRAERAGAGTRDWEILEGLARSPPFVLLLLTVGWWAWQGRSKGEAVRTWFAPA